MSTHEDSIPFRFSPDGLDEAAIDELIAQSYDDSEELPPPVDLAERRRARTAQQRPNPFGGEAA